MLKPKTSLSRGAAFVALLSTLIFGISVSAELPPLPGQTGTPTPGPVTDGPYAPQALVPGGIVIPIFPADSSYLNQERITEAEKYGSYNPPNVHYITNIHNPSIEFHAGNGSLDTGTTIILMGGGGHRTLGVGGEGADVISFFKSFGVNTIILRNRLRSDGYEPKTDGVYDVLQAVKLTRAYADQLGIDPNKIGVLGFSAGGELAAGAALFYDEFDAKNDVPENPLAKFSSRPDFAGLIYTGPSPFFNGGSADIPRDSPPVFLAGPGWGDWIHALWSTEYFTALLNDGVPNVEMHIYARGVHPGSAKEGQPPATSGISDRDGVAWSTWQDRYMDWMTDLGFMNKPGVETRAAIDIAANLERENPLKQLKIGMAKRAAAKKDD